MASNDVYFNIDNDAAAGSALIALESGASPETVNKVGLAAQNAFEKMKTDCPS